MEGPNTTLRFQLTQKKPRIFYISGKSGNGSNDAWPIIETVNAWSDFNLTNLNNTYAHLLNETRPGQPLYPQVNAWFGRSVSLVDTKDLNRLICWNDALMQPALDAVKQHFFHTQGYALSYDCSPVDGPNNIKVRVSSPNTSNTVGVNHVVALNKTPKQNLVIGFTRPSSKFSVGEIMRDYGPLNTIRSRHEWVFSQLGHYCNFANTQYGYIQTEKELVVCKFEKTLNPDKLCVHVMPIPWTNHGPTVLTTDLALWWLCVKALSLPAGPQMEDV